MSNKLYGFTKTQRVRSHQEFDIIYQSSFVYEGRYAFFFIHRDERNCARLGLTASRRVGPSVQRSLLKRRYREIFRLNQNFIVAGAVIVVNIKRVAATVSYRDLEKDWKQQLLRAKCWVAR